MARVLLSPTVRSWSVGADTQWSSKVLFMNSSAEYGEPIVHQTRMLPQPRSLGHVVFGVQRYWEIHSCVLMAVPCVDRMLIVYFSMRHSSLEYDGMDGPDVSSRRRAPPAPAAWWRVRATTAARARDRPRDAMIRRGWAAIARFARQNSNRTNVDEMLTETGQKDRAWLSDLEL